MKNIHSCPKGAFYLAHSKILKFCLPSKKFLPVILKRKCIHLLLDIPVHYIPVFTLHSCIYRNQVTLDAYIL